MARKPRASYHHGDLAAALRTTARALVARHGAAGFSLRAAAKETGVDPAAVYRHYKDKQALLDAVAIDGFVELAADMEQAQAAKRTPPARLVAIGDAYVRFALREPELFRVMVGRQRTDVATVAAVAAGGRSPYQIMLAVLGELREAGLSTLPPERAALPAWAAVHGLAYLAIDGRVNDVDAAIREVTRAVLRSLAPGSGR